jgi:hypothetical protein
LSKPTPRSAVCDRSKRSCRRIWKKTAEATRQQVAREINQLLRVVFNGRRKTGRLDLEAVETAVRAAMHHAGSDATVNRSLSSSFTVANGGRVVADHRRGRVSRAADRRTQDAFESGLHAHHLKAVGGKELTEDCCLLAVSPRRRALNGTAVRNPATPAKTFSARGNSRYTARTPACPP